MLNYNKKMFCFQCYKLIFYIKNIFTHAGSFPNWQIVSVMWF